MKNFKFISMIVFIVTLIVGSFFVSTKNTFAADSVLKTQDFVVWNQGGLAGYDAGFSLTGATFNEAQSIVIKLYSGNTLLQTNTAIYGKITGTGFLTPFDVFGTFDYAKDGYFTNVRGSEYGQTLAPTKVVATVTLSDGKILTTTNTNLTTSSILTPLPEGCAPGYLFSVTTGQPCGTGQVLGAEKFQFTLSMKSGSSGNEIMELQNFLNTAGYDCGVADGKFGPKTKTAVINFQVANGLEGDGIVGALTRSILNQ